MTSNSTPQPTQNSPEKKPGEDPVPTNIYENDVQSMPEKLTILGYTALVAITFPCTAFSSFQMIQQYQRGVIFRLGKLKKGGAHGPGMCFINPYIDFLRILDMRTVTHDVPPQEILTKDSVSVTVDAVIHYRIKDPMFYVVRVADGGYSTRMVAAATLRNELGTRTLSELLSERASIARLMRIHMDQATEPWGVEIERVEITDIILPVQLQKAMAAEAEATREAKAKIIAAEGEVAASRALKEASMLMVDNPMALQLRYLQSLTAISAGRSSMIVFPFPMEFLRAFIEGPNHVGTNTR